MSRLIRPFTMVTVIVAMWCGCGVLLLLPVTGSVEASNQSVEKSSGGSTTTASLQNLERVQLTTVEPKKMIRSLTQHSQSTAATVSHQPSPQRSWRGLIMKKKRTRPQISTVDNDNSFSLTFKRLLHGYDKNDPPSRDNPTKVQLGIYVNSFYSISEQTMDYSVSLYLRQKWIDRRLAYETTDWRQDHVRLGLDSWSSVWTPDTFFRNEKSASFHTVTLANRLMRLHRNGTLWYVIKISATLSCPMSLQKYPLDTQECPIMFESFGYNTDTLQLAWLEGGPIEIEDSMQVPQFTLAQQKLIDCKQNYTAGEFPCLEIRFVFRRNIGFFLIQVYVPSVLIVILSWVSFWINVDASPARVSIGLLTVLTTTTMSGGARATLPRVSYIKAIDVWMIVCLVFVFASLIEYAIVNVIARKIIRIAAPPSSLVTAAAGNGDRFSSKFRARWPPKRSIGSTDTNDKQSTTHIDQQQQQPASSSARSNIQLPTSSTASGTSMILCGRLTTALQAATSAGTQETDCKQTARKIDRMSRKLFPTCFVVFNLVYWTFYTWYPFSVDGESAPHL